MEKLKQWRNQPYFTYLFLSIQTVVFFACYLLPRLQLSGVMYGPAIVYQHEYWRLITPMFLHFGLMHFAVNSLVLSQMGKQIETIYGHWRFFFIYMLSGIGGNVLSFALNDTHVQAAGASTALFGLFGAFLILRVHFKDNPLIRALAKQFTLFIFLSFLFSAFDSSIDMSGHLGGLVSGLLLGNILGLPKDKPQYSIHTRIICTMIFVFLLVICVIYGFKKY